MTRIRSTLASALLVPLLATACEQAPTEPITLSASAPDAAVIEQESVPFVQDFFNPCTGEVVPLRGWTRYTYKVTSDSAGGYHVGYHQTAHATGVGHTTGTEYVLTLKLDVERNVKGPFPHTFTRIFNQVLIAKGEAEDRMGRGRVHFTINANGELSVSFSDLQIVCQ